MPTPDFPAASTSLPTDNAISISGTVATAVHDNLLGHLKLGKAPARKDQRTLRLVDYLHPVLPFPPAGRDWTDGRSDWGVMCNDRLGCCVLDACAHAVQVWAHAGSRTAFELTDAEVEDYYGRWEGYNPADPSTDQGGVMLDVLNLWRKQELKGRELEAYVAVSPHNTPRVKQAICLFGGLAVGLQLPMSAQDSDHWQVGSSPSLIPRWGGHAVYIASYDADGLTAISWGRNIRMSWDFFQEYCDEAYALLGKDWYGTVYCDASGLNLKALHNDLVRVVG